MRFLKSNFESIQNEAKKSAKLNEREICGLILDKGPAFELIQVRNKTKRGGGFSFYVNEVRAIQKMARMCKQKIVGTFHSHPVGLPDPGASDLRHAVNDSMMLIFDIAGRSARLWLIKGRKAKQMRFSLI